MIAVTADTQRLSTIVTQTDTLMDLAEYGKWDELIELEEARAVLIERLFAKKPKIEPAKLAAGIQYILDKNKVLALFSQSHRDSIRLEMSEAKHVHNAVGAYLNTV
jgi:nicotinic acid mononucleotide adenylyltransferase